MTQQAPEPTPIPGAVPTPPPANTHTASAPVLDEQAQALLLDAVAAAEAENAAKESTLPDDPAALKAEIERLRKENGAARTKAKENAANDARQNLANEIGKILGLVEDDTPVDPGALTQQLAESRSTSRQLELELAVYKVADVAGANPSALLDSRSFLTSVASVDPTDVTSITQAITQAVAANPAFGKGTAAPAPRMLPNPAQASSSMPPMSIAEQAQAAQAAGNTREAIRLKSTLALSDQ